MLNLLARHKDVVYSLVNQGGRLLLAIVLLPFALSSLSNAELTVWFLLTTLVTFGQSVIVGFASTFVRFIAYSSSGVLFENYSKQIFDSKQQCNSDSNKQEIGRLLYVQWLIYSALTLIFLISVGVLGYFALKVPIDSVMDKSYTWSVSIFVLLTSTVSVYLSMYQVIMEGNDKVKDVQKIGALWHFCGVLITLLVLTYESTLFTLVLCYQLVVLGNMITIYFSCYNPFSENPYKFGKPIKNFDTSMFKHILDSAWKIGFTSLFASGAKQISGIVVAQVFASQTAASFLLTKRLFEILETFSQVTFRSKLPKLIGLFGVGNLPEYVRSLRSIVRLSYLIYILGFVIILYAGPLLISIFDHTGDKSLGSTTLIILFGLSGLISRWGAIYLSVANHANRILDHKAVIISTAVFVMFVYASFDALGVISFPIGTILGSLATSYLIIKTVYPLISERFLKFEKFLVGEAFIYWLLAVFIFSFLNWSKQ